MQALSVELRLESLYSMKVPFTHQSGLTYPLPPPSTLKGLLANALQRWEGIGPLEALGEVEGQVRALAAWALGPIVVGTYIVSAVTAFEAGPGRKPTDALARQFAGAAGLGLAIVGEDPVVARLAAALARTAVYLGDTESLVTCQGIGRHEVTLRMAQAGEWLQLRGYAPAWLLEGYDPGLDIYWVQAECARPQALHPYLFPLQRAGHRLLPATIAARLTAEAPVVEGEAFGALLMPPQTAGEPPARRRRRR
jgi:CRISPR-associated Cas5-like protein